MTQSGAVEAAVGQPVVLLVDDNRPYREAFRRHLELHDIEVIEAENSDEAVAALGASAPAPTMVITDLQMRSETEGLDLIRAIRSTAPILPIALISAVGTFEEGAEAHRLGAVAVFSKARLDEDLTRLVDRVVACSARYELDGAAAARLEQARAQLETANVNSNDGTQTPDPSAEPANLPAVDPEQALATVRSVLADAQLHPYLRDEAYAILAQAESMDRVRASRSAVPDAGDILIEAEAALRADLSCYDDLAPDSREALLAAEVLRLQSAKGASLVDFSRNQGFSYCFAVENEAKARLGRRILKFLASDATYELIPALLNAHAANPSLTIYFHQHLLLLLRGRDMDITIDNIRQTVLRLYEHRNRYKPDGLKALGILIITFGRDYSLQAGKQMVRINNPLGIRGLTNSEEVIDFAQLLVSLQHYRNPYIHPEISDLEKVTKIRETTLQCLELTARVQP
jgi:CheY-like chemotaxis protein